MNTNPQSNRTFAKLSLIVNKSHLFKQVQLVSPVRSIVGTVGRGI